MSTAIVEFSKFEADLSAYRQRYEGVVYDFGDKKQEKQARSDRLAIGKTISALDAIHKEIKAPLQEKISLLDGERKRIKDGLRDVQGGIKAQIEAHEEKLRQHEERIATRIATIAGTAIFAEAEPSLADIKLNIERLRSMIVDEETFEHRYGDAAVAKLKATETLNKLLEEAQEREEAAAEAERQRLAQEEEERKAAEEARQAELARIQEEARARAEREAAEKLEAERTARIVAEQKAKQAAQEAADAAARAEENARIAAERAAEEERAKAAAKAAAEEEARLQREAEAAAVEARRKANIEHRRQVNSAAAHALSSVPGMNMELSQAVVKAIAHGLVPNITINY